MELIEGRTLRQLLDTGSMPVLKVIQDRGADRRWASEGARGRHHTQGSEAENLMLSSKDSVKFLTSGWQNSRLRAAIL